MNKSALPDYMRKHLKSSDIPPGHWFGLYFPVWRANWEKADEQKIDALKKVLGISPISQKMMDAMVQRQRSVAIQLDFLECFSAKSTSPFVTGIGNEHPLENGFSFLNPYGLPYLPGSGVKGVLRMAAEELALGLYDEKCGWDMLTVWWLFGFEGGSSYLSDKSYHIDVLDEEAGRRRQAYREWVEMERYDTDSLMSFIEMTVGKKKRSEYPQPPKQFLLKLPDDISNQGVLQFWDVYPQSRKLAMDILTPHHGGYYRGEHAPHDSEQPNPNIFLTVPTGSQFDFYCRCEIARLPLVLQSSWQGLLQAAFQYAFEWMGFGAKTAMGYGQMQENKQALRNFKQEKEELNNKREKEARLKKLPPVEREIEQVLKSNRDPNKKGYLVLLDAVKNEKWQEQDKRTVLLRIRKLMEESGKWKESTNRKNPERDKEYQRTLEIKRLLVQND